MGNDSGQVITNMVFSVDMFCSFIEKEMQEWKENDLKGLMTLKEDDSVAEESPWHGQPSPTVWESEKSQHDEEKKSPQCGN